MRSSRRPISEVKWRPSRASLGVASNEGSVLKNAFWEAEIRHLKSVGLTRTLICFQATFVSLVSSVAPAARC
jgi:hypothetical protein